MLESRRTTLRQMTELDLALVLSWRNHSQVRNFMICQHEISYTEHAGWFFNAPPHRHLLIFEVDGTPQGFINIERPRAESGFANWGFYKAPDSLKGIGLELGGAGLEYAFQVMKLERINAKVQKFNQRSINLHLRLGFELEGRGKNLISNDGHHDVLQFSLIAEQWLHTNQRRK